MSLADKLGGTKPANELTPAPKLPKKTNGHACPDSSKRLRKYAEVTLAALCADLASTPEGTRNDALNAHAMQLGHMVCSGWIGESTVRADLLAAAKRCGLAETESAMTFESGFGKGVTEPAKEPPDNSPVRKANGTRHHDDYPLDESTPEAAAAARNDGGPAEEHAKQQTKPRFAFEQLGNLSIAPANRDWFVSVKQGGAKLLLMSKAFVIAADGDTGKSFLLLMWSICAALGIDLFETFHFERVGHVALFMAEDDLLGCKHRIYRICNQLGLSSEQRQKLDEYLHLCPLTGVEISLLAVDARGNAQRTEIFEELVQFLKREANNGSFQWVFVGIDPLARFAGEAESSNAMATAFVQGLEALIDAVPGKPALVSTHHSSKASVRDGRVDIRGATGIRNAFRAAFTMLKVKAKSGVEGVLLANDKHNDSVGADDIWLVRCKDEPDGRGGFTVMAGALRRASPPESDELDTALSIRRTGKEIVSENEYVTRVIETVSKRPHQLKSGRDVVKFTKGNASKVRDALKDALRDGLIAASEDKAFYLVETHQ